MKVKKEIKTQGNNKKSISLDFRNTRSSAWNNKRRFGL